MLDGPHNLIFVLETIFVLFTFPFLFQGQVPLVQY